ncbi:MAG TPA: hypothetical protein VFI65_12040 [Streptosporangiaceae bacterium]|nr:hypothetical protein [Streptosporangiaceae bacterium]
MTAASTAAQVRLATATAAAGMKEMGVGEEKRWECGGMDRLRQRHANVLLCYVSLPIGYEPPQIFLLNE